MNVRIFSVCVASLALSALASPFDAAMLVGRTDKAPTEYRAGLGDYTSPPSGITVFYNNLVNAKSRKIDYVQGSRHGYIPPKK